ncbi:MarR family winged helix-turn-helix transcriptional regulator [Streptomyces noursei]|uniref:MarR family winged helix-turn-helix transcriptional regulator n=1 Tax=Streptomyces noursei TaxID=1971 RepID=UPI0023B7CC4C|nr:MarR family transcriptional regulator [Streptomyces noursei]
MPALDLSTHPGHLARRLQQAHTLLWTTIVSEDVTSPQFAVLNTLVDEDGLDQRTVGERVGLDRSTIAEVVRRLVARELIEKTRDAEDARRSVLRLTAQGSRLHHKLAGRTARMNQIFLAPLDLEEQDVFLELLHRVSAAAEGLRRPAIRPPGTTRS